MWPYAVAAQPRLHGHDVVAVTERPELRGQPDTVVFAIAQAEARAIVTENAVDFRPLVQEVLERGAQHAGLVLTSDRRFPRHDPRTVGRPVTVLDLLLSSGIEIGGIEHWLT